MPKWDTYTFARPPFCVPLPFAAAVCWHKHSGPVCKGVEYTILGR